MKKKRKKDNCLYTADFLVGCQKSGEKLRIQWKHKHNFKTTTLKFAFVLLILDLYHLYNFAKPVK